MRMRHVHSQRLERWLGTDRVEKLSRDFRDWYGPPVHLIDVPGSVRVTKGGEFIGPFEYGYFGSAADNFRDYIRRVWKELGVHQPALAAAGFTSISDALARASGGFQQHLNGNIAKSGPTGVVGVASSLWRVGAQPTAGGAGSAAPAGRAPTKATTGAMAFNNPASGTLHLTGADFSASVINNSLLIYDRIFDVAKTMNSTAAESVTGVPTRYQSSTPSADDYAGGNFLMIEVGGTALAATAHNWSSCTYRNQAGTDAQALPTVTGNSGAIVDRLDQPVNTWFCPLAAGDSGIMDLANIQCSAAVATGAINFVIGHPLGVMQFPIINSLLPFNWLTNRNLAPRIFADACVALLELPKPATTATTYSGQLYAVGAA
ncbi:MAG TPA: hypothetical protein PLJ74_12040 [Myxococcota bacterium]|nr:hypothetical protein [Myxococcota bacterium]